MHRLRALTSSRSSTTRGALKVPPHPAREQRLTTTSTRRACLVRPVESISPRSPNQLRTLTARARKDARALSSEVPRHAFSLPSAERPGVATSSCRCFREKPVDEQQSRLQNSSHLFLTFVSFCSLSLASDPRLRRDGFFPRDLLINGISKKLFPLGDDDRAPCPRTHRQKSEPNADPTRSSGNCGRRFKRQRHRAAAKLPCVKK